MVFVVLPLSLIQLILNVYLDAQQRIDVVNLRHEQYVQHIVQIYQIHVVHIK